MTPTMDHVVSHYIFSSHPRNKAIVDIKNKKTGQLCFIKIRHRLSKFYAVSLVDPVTFEASVEIQAPSATSRVKPMTLHFDNKTDILIDFRETARLGFEWSFEWEGEKYRWMRQSRMSQILECKAIRKTGDICVAQYLPRILTDEYFGIFTVLRYNMSRCHLTQFDRLEPVLILSLLTLLDKSKDGDWKKDTVSKGDILDDLDTQPIPKKAQQKKQKAELLNDQKLQLMVNKDVRRSQKQIQLDEKYSMSAGNSPAHSPKGSPLPTPSSSASQLNTKDQSLKASSHGKLARLFNSLSTYQQDNEPVSRDQSLEKHYDHQSSLPAGYVYRDNPPPSLKSIQWDTKKKFSGSLDYQTKVPYSNRHSTSEYYYQ